MAKRASLLIGAVVLAAMAAGCGRDQGPANPSGPTWSAAASSAGGATALSPAGQGGKMVARDVTGSVNGRFDFTEMWGPEWWQIYASSTCTGTLTHLGLSTLYTRHRPNFTTFDLEEGTFRIVAANGDEIRGTYEGHVAPDPERADLVHGTATFVITEGTGRFEEATGSFDVVLLEVLDDPTWVSAGATWTISGTVTY